MFNDGKPQIIIQNNFISNIPISLHFFHYDIIKDFI